MLCDNAGETRRVSLDTLQLLDKMIAAWGLTNGAFDPTMRTEIERLGYDRDLSLRDEFRRATNHCDTHTRASVEDIQLDFERQFATLPHGMRLDPGGIGKGLASAIVADELIGRGAVGAMVNLGGDITVLGDAPNGDCWSLDVGDPLATDHAIDAAIDETVKIVVRSGGIATSSPLRRRWSDQDGNVYHHLLDPTTGASLATTIAAVTAVAGEAWWAEAITKAVFVRGTSHTVSNACARIVYADGTWQTIGDQQLCQSVFRTVAIPEKADAIH